MRVEDEVATRTGERWRIDRILGEGSQGQVVRIVSVDRPDRCAALKWYGRGTFRPWQRRAIEALVERGSPGPMFLWPREVLTLPGDSFGYVMGLMPGGFVGLSRIMRGDVAIRPSVAVRVAIGLADGFLRLHAQGLCYRDISFGNVLADLTTGHVLICDNDNVGIDGVSRTAVLGTRRFMAPEVIRGESAPSTQTDLHALAVLIFSLLMVQHPLLGRRELDYPCLDREAEDVLFGRNPLFIFDPDDRDNAPDPEVHAGVTANWHIHPAGLRRVFVSAFTEGLSQPSRRVRESVWRAELARTLDRVATCPACGSETFYEGESVQCWNCQARITAPPVLRFPRETLVLSDGACVYRHHLVRDYNVTDVVGRIARHPVTGRWGLVNEGDDAWRVSRGDTTATVAPGQTVGLVAGVRIDFGSQAAVIDHG